MALKAANSYKRNLDLAKLPVIMLQTSTELLQLREDIS